MPYADEIDTSSAISGMADVLDQAADVVSRGLDGGASMGIGPGNIAGDKNPIAPGYDASQVTTGSDLTGPPIEQDAGYEMVTSLTDKSPYGVDPNAAAMMGGGPSTDTMPQSIYGGGSGTAPDVTNLGDKPSLQAMQAAIESVGGGPAMGGGPADMIAGLMGGEEAAEETSPGADAATFLSDFDRGMSAKSPEQGLVAKIDALQDQAAQLQAQVAGTQPSRMGGGPQDIRNVVQPGAQFAAGVPQGPYTQESMMTEQQMNQATPPAVSTPASLINRNIQSQMGGGPSDINEAPLGSYDYRAGRVNEPVPKSSMERLYESITNLGGSEMGAGGPDVPGMLRHDAGYDVVRDPHSTAMGTPNQAYLASQAGLDIPGVTSFEGTPVDQEDVAPKYSGKTVTVETQDQMYPGHKNFATMAGVSSILSTIDGSHAGWIDAINKDMVARGIELTHEINGVKTGKHSSADWKEYSALFDPETGLDSNGVPMPGTAGAPVEEITVTGSLPMSRQDRLIAEGKLPDLRFLPDDIKDITPELRARMEKVVNEWRLSQQQAGQVNANQAATVGDDTRGDNPVDIIRSTYTWAASLPNNVLFNAARYPDYLRLLIEYDAAGKDLPLTVPTWILEGTGRPAEDDEEQSSLFANHPAMQTQELTWAT